MGRRDLDRASSVAAALIAERSRPIPTRTVRDLRGSIAHPDDGYTAAAIFFQQPATWMEEAACAGQPTDTFFPEIARGRHATTSEDVRRAAAVCAGCPVRQDCLDYARNTETKHGVWGGVYFSRGREVPVAA